MRKCYEDVKNENSEACEYTAELKERFAKEVMYQQFVDAILDTEGASSEQSKVVVL